MTRRDDLIEQINNAITYRIISLKIEISNYESKWKKNITRKNLENRIDALYDKLYMWKKARLLMTNKKNIYTNSQLHNILTKLQKKGLKNNSILNI